MNVLVVGASGAIGSAISIAFLKKRHSLILHASSEKSIMEIEKKIYFYIKQPKTFTINSSEIFDDLNLPLYMSDVDILVNAAGGGAHQSWDDTTIDKWDSVYRLNVLMLVFFIKKLLPFMKNKKYGRIIKIASVSAVRTLEIGPKYSSSKAGLVILTESLAKELANTGVSAHCISPGLVLTDLVKTIFSENYFLNSDTNDCKLHKFISKEFFPNLIGKIPLPNDIVKTVLFLSSHDSDKITGQNIVIDSGYLFSNYVSDSVE